jgi:hypothetical protein
MQLGMTQSFSAGGFGQRIHHVFRYIPQELQSQMHAFRPNPFDIGPDFPQQVLQAAYLFPERIREINSEK